MAGPSCYMRLHLRHPPHGAILPGQKWLRECRNHLDHHNELLRPRRAAGGLHELLAKNTGNLWREKCL